MLNPIAGVEVVVVVVMSCQFVHSIGALDSSVQAYSTALMPIPAETDALLTQEVSAHTRTNAKSGTLIRVWGAWDVYRLGWECTDSNVQRILNSSQCEHHTPTRLATGARCTFFSVKI